MTEVEQRAASSSEVEFVPRRPDLWSKGPASGIPASGLPASGAGHGGPAQGPGQGGPALGAALAPITSGSRAPRVYGPFAEQLAAGLAEDRPDLASYPEAVAGWATAEAVAALLRRHLAEVGPVDPETKQTRDRLLQELTRAENSAAKHRALLGLDPRSEASLARERAEAATLAVDLGALAERGRRALAARAGQPPAPDLAGMALDNARAETAARWAGR